MNVILASKHIHYSLMLFNAAIFKCQADQFDYESDIESKINVDFTKVY